MEFIELKQKHVDLFISKLPRDIPVNIVFYDTPRYASAIVRAAMAAGWFEFSEDVDECKPNKVLALAREVFDTYNKAIEISPS